MTTKAAIESRTNASGDLTITHHIPAEQLEAVAEVYELALASIREAIRARDEQAARRRAIVTEVAEAKRAHDALCLRLRRLKRRGAPKRALCRAAAAPWHMTRDMLHHGNALARARLADVKKQHIIECWRKGIGVRPTARIVAARFGHCSPAYVSRILKQYMERIQPRLTLRELRLIK